MLKPGSRDYKIFRGVGFPLNLTWKSGSTGTPVDLTDFSAILTATAEDGTSFELTSDDLIVLGGVAGTIAITLDDTYTSNLAIGTYIYTLLLKSGTYSKLLLIGKLFIQDVGL